MSLPAKSNSWSYCYCYYLSTVSYNTCRWCQNSRNTTNTSCKYINQYTTVKHDPVHHLQITNFDIWRRTRWWAASDWNCSWSFKLIFISNLSFIYQSLQRLTDNSLTHHTHARTPASSFTNKIKNSAVSVVTVTEFPLPPPPTNQHRHLGVLLCRLSGQCFPKTVRMTQRRTFDKLHSPLSTSISAQLQVLDRRPPGETLVTVTWLRWLSTVNGLRDRTGLIQLHLVQFLSSLDSSILRGAGRGWVNKASSSRWRRMSSEARPAACDPPLTHPLPASANITSTRPTLHAFVAFTCTEHPSRWPV